MLPRLVSSKGSLNFMAAGVPGAASRGTVTRSSSTTCSRAKPEKRPARSSSPRNQTKDHSIVERMLAECGLGWLGTMPYVGPTSFSLNASFTTWGARYSPCVYVTSSWVASTLMEYGGDTYSLASAYSPAVTSQ